ncbi:hypothetical protein Sru01_30310 [Sphaerisporangium rufum]|uniref:Uncharacterized protein n=1 Tax=Sphaerisporangium rufum TaxID=1381558 RepID=A0A919R1T2_9ACTN|nr:hypothetical protein [Sphaerisporangium rufum]GII78049.1 hypothetical protein Sru01_30310 [Sphaerisporangium rufum]
MATPLQYGDPPRLGGYVVQARLQTLPTGFVYLAQEGDGRTVSVALLTRGAAMDAAARERFLTAVRQAAPVRGGVRGWVARARGRSAAGGGGGGAPQVVAMHDGPAPWVAVPYLPGGPGAEWFLRSVLVTGTLIGQAHGPDFVPYWLGDRVPAVPLPPPPAPPPTETRRAVVAAASALAVLLTLTLTITWLLLFRSEEPASPSRPPPPTMFVPTPPPVPSPRDTLTTTPTPSPGDTGATPRPSPPDGDPGEDI